MLLKRSPRIETGYQRARTKRTESYFLAYEAEMSTWIFLSGRTGIKGCCVESPSCNERRFDNNFPFSRERNTLIYKKLYLIFMLCMINLGKKVLMGNIIS